MSCTGSLAGTAVPLVPIGAPNVFAVPTLPAPGTTLTTRVCTGFEKISGAATITAGGPMVLHVQQSQDGVTFDIENRYTLDIAAACVTVPFEQQVLATYVRMTASGTAGTLRLSGYVTKY